MTRVVIDTNVLVSALLTDRGAEASVLDFVASGQLLWCVSEAVLAEYRLVLNRPKFRHIDPTKIVAALTLARKGRLAIVTETITFSPDDPDNRFLECAEAANANFLITGNKRHFPAQWKSTKIVNARECLVELSRT